jgi:hypothetical protein
LKADVSRCIPQYSEQLDRLCRFSEHTVYLATGIHWPSASTGVEQITFIANVFPKLVYDPTASLLTSPALTEEQLANVHNDSLGEIRGGSGIGGNANLVPVAFDAEAAARIAENADVPPTVPRQTTPATTLPVPQHEPQLCCYLRGKLGDQVHVLTEKVTVLEQLLQAAVNASSHARTAFSVAFRRLHPALSGLLGNAIAALTFVSHPAPASAAAADDSDASTPITGAPATKSQQRDIPRNLSAEDAYLLVSLFAQYYRFSFNIRF